MSASGVLNPFSDIVIGYRNHNTSVVRSKYRIYSLSDAPTISSIVYGISQGTKKFDDVDAADLSELVESGFLVPETKGVRMRFWLALKNPLIERPFRSVLVNDKSYLVSSYVFMGFTTKRGHGEMKNTFILPRWQQRLGRAVYRYLESKGQVNGWSSALTKKMWDHGILIQEDVIHEYFDFFKKNMTLSVDRVASLLGKTDETVRAPCVAEMYFDIRDVKGLSRPVDAWARRAKPNVWFVHPVRGTMHALWFDDQLRDAARLVAKDASVFSSLPLGCQDALVSLELVIDRETLSARQAAWRATLDSLRNEYVEKKTILIKNALIPIENALMRKFAAFLYDKQHYILDQVNGKTKNRYWQHCNDYTYYMQEQVAKLINSIVANKVKTGHNAITRYTQGAVLPVHKDDVTHFQLVCTLVIDDALGLPADQCWPLRADADGVPTALHLARGDAGVMVPQMPHWRDELKDPHMTAMIMWFVADSFKGYVNGKPID